MCDLCILEDRTNTYHETDEFIILDCDSCLIPMAVWKEHTMSLNPKDEKRMEDSLIRGAKQFYNHDNFRIDKNQRAIPDHLHWHARLIVPSNPYG